MAKFFQRKNNISFSLITNVLQKKLKKAMNNIKKKAEKTMRFFKK
jgi:hypothetical protein